MLTSGEFAGRHLLAGPAGNVTIHIAQSDISTNSLLGKFNGAGGE